MRGLIERSEFFILSSSNVGLESFLVGVSGILLITDILIGSDGLAFIFLLFFFCFIFDGPLESLYSDVLQVRLLESLE